MIPFGGDRVLGLAVEPPSTGPDDPLIALSQIAGKDPRALEIIVQHDALEKAAKIVLRDVLAAEIVNLEAERGELRGKCRAAEDRLNELQYSFNGIMSMLAFVDTSPLQRAQEKLDQATPRSKFPNPVEMAKYREAQRHLTEVQSSLEAAQVERRSRAQQLNFEIEDAEKALKERTGQLHQLDSKIAALKTRWQQEAAPGSTTISFL